MTTYTSPTAFTFTGAIGTRFTDGYYQLLKELRNALVACGMVQTADTGQQDFTLADNGTVAPPLITNGILSNFFIMRMNDALQATKPFFLKIRLISNTSTGIQGLQLQMGSGTDGAGTITGAVGSKTLACSLHSSASSSGLFNTTNQRLTYASGNGSEMVVSIHEAPNTIGESILLTIERTRNDAGVYDGEGVLVQVINAAPHDSTSGAHTYHAVFPTNGATYDLSYGFMRGQIIPRVIPDRATFVSGNDFGPLLPFGGGFFPKFRQTHVAYLFPHADMSTYGNTFTIPIYGVQRTFRQIGWQYSLYAQWNHHGGSSSSGIELQRYAAAMMWE